MIFSWQVRDLASRSRVQKAPGYRIAPNSRNTKVSWNSSICRTRYVGYLPCHVSWRNGANGCNEPIRCNLFAKSPRLHGGVIDFCDRTRKSMERSKLGDRIVWRPFCTLPARWLRFSNATVWKFYTFLFGSLVPRIFCGKLSVGGNFAHFALPMPFSKYNAPGLLIKWQDFVSHAKFRDCWHHLLILLCACYSGRWLEQ